MDILFVSRCLPYPLHHGDRLLAHHLVSALTTRGHRFDLLAFYLDEADLQHTRHFADMFEYVEPIRERPRSRLDYLKRLAHVHPDTAASCWNPLMWEAIERRLLHKRYDLIHLFGGIQVYEFRNLVQRWPNLIVPYDSYALFLKRALRQSASLQEKIRLQIELSVAQIYESIIYRGFGQTVLVSKNDESYLQRLAPGLSTTVIPNGVDLDHYAPRQVTHHIPIIAFVGNYAYHPNLTAAMSLITEILPYVRRELPEAGAILIGPEPPVSLTSLAGNGIEVTGYVSDIRLYLARATCFVAPLILGSGMRNKILEAMAMEIPVVSTPLGCEGIAVTDGENVLLGEGAEELARGIIRLCEDETYHRRIAAGGKQLVSQMYSWQTTASRYENLYESLIAEFHAS